ncbi:hypothetical protein [Spiroplasma endosymbiont of Tricholauxania praeusta]
MFILPFVNHFDWDKHYYNQNELNLQQTEELLSLFSDNFLLVIE